jgi:hypothetical protein
LKGVESDIMISFSTFILYYFLGWMSMAVAATNCETVTAAEGERITEGTKGPRAVVR